MNPDLQLIRDVARRTLDIEAQALQSVVNQFEHTGIVEAVALMAKTPGRVIFTGVGKSAIVAQKIVATLNSTGTPALYMHATDAIHGDLGMISPGEVVVCISKSGNTPEIQVLIPLLLHRGCPVIGMTAERESWLARHAYLTIYTPVEKEADPNNLAPTSSTTVQMAVGDAMATALLAIRGFSPDDFAQLHPGGMLGKQLYLRVSDICSHNPAPIVSETSTLEQVIIEITANRLGATAVAGPRGNITGIITDGDLRRMLNSNLDLRSIIARDLMSDKPKTLSWQSLAVDALSLMRENKIMQIIVMQGDEYMGMVHLHDLVREGII